MAQLHGVETIELTSGTVAVTTIQTAIIGLVGTARDASGGVAASGVTGTMLLNNQMTFTAKRPGRAGNQIIVNAVAGIPDPDEPDTVPTTAVMDGNTLTITLGCDEQGKINAMTASVKAAMDGISDVSVIIYGSGGGAVSPFTLPLSGGEDEPFPLNVPVAVVGSTMMSKLGTRGTLPQAMSEINAQRNALVVVVRVDEADSGKAEEQRAAVIAGINTLSLSKSVTTWQPRILIAPEFSEDDAVGRALETVAGKLRAVAYVDCESGATLQEVVQRRQSYGARTELLRPRVQVSNTAGQLVYRPYSAFAAGLRARIDYEKGWWWSKSNQDVYNMLGVEQIDEFIPGDENCEANLLNMQNVSTLIRRAGFKHWGNRLCATDPQWRFESVRRTADVIEDSIQETMLEYVDRPLDRENADDIIGTINAYLRQLVGLGAIFGGRAWLDEELNTAESLAAGVLYINYDFGPKSPTELISLRVRVNNNYALEEMLTA